MCRHLIVNFEVIVEDSFKTIFYPLQRYIMVVFERSELL